MVWPGAMKMLGVESRTVDGSLLARARVTPAPVAGAPKATTSGSDCPKVKTMGCMVIDPAA